MGVKSAGIVLQSGQQGVATFTPGQTVSGAMVLEVNGGKPHQLSAAYVKVRGAARTDWKTGSGDSETSHSETEWLLRLEIPLLRAAPGQVTTLPPGQHRLPFSFTMPERLPHSQKYSDGKVVYLCKARAVSRGFCSFGGRAEVRCTVPPHRDLRREPHLARPLTVQRQARWSLLGRDPGPFQVTLTRQGFAGGEVIDVWLDGPDQAFRALAEADGLVKLKRRVVFRARSSTTQKKLVVAAVQPGRAPAAWRHLQLPVPAGEVSVDGDCCRIITVSHYVKVRDVHLPVTLGTVPLPPS